jgi:hypothetical protein
MIDTHALPICTPVEHLGLAIGAKRESLAAACQHPEVVVIGMVFHHQDHDVPDLRQKIAAGRERRPRKQPGLLTAHAARQSLQLIPL